LAAAQDLLGYGGALTMPRAPRHEGQPQPQPAGDPIDYASTALRRMLAKQRAVVVAEDEAVVRVY
jgi:hypothetical protein